MDARAEFGVCMGLVLAISVLTLALIAWDRAQARRFDEPHAATPPEPWA